MIKIHNWFSGITNGDVAFTQNDKYTYTFKGKTIITAPTGTLEGESEVLIFGIANIVGTKSCGAVLYLKHVKISHDSKVGHFFHCSGYFYFKRNQCTFYIIAFDICIYIIC